MSSNESAVREIRGMGYKIPTLQKAGEGYHRIGDGTGSILRLSAHINGLIAGPRPGDYIANTITNLFVFTPTKFRHPEKSLPSMPDPRSTVVDEDVAHETISNEPSVYVVDGNTTVSVMPVIGQIRKTSSHSPNGEPVYIVSSYPIFKVLGAVPARKP